MQHMQDLTTRLRTPNFEYETAISRVDLGGLSLEIEHLADIDKTIDQLFEHYLAQGKKDLFEEMCPYFGIIWPAARVLAQVVAERETSWRNEWGERPRVLELGCGLALPSLVLAARGWSVVARDLHPDVEYFLARNRSRLPGVDLVFERADWQEPRQEAWHLVLASDVLYDRSQPASLARYLATSLKGTLVDSRAGHEPHPEPGAAMRALVCDPGRGYLDEFISRCRDLGLSVSSEGLFGCRILELRSA
jgi:predicted nicotinamide N-methyase